MMLRKQLHITLWHNLECILCILTLLLTQLCFLLQHSPANAGMEACSRNSCLKVRQVRAVCYQKAAWNPAVVGTRFGPRPLEVGVEEGCATRAGGAQSGSKHFQWPRLHHCVVRNVVFCVSRGMCMNPSIKQHNAQLGTGSSSGVCCTEADSLAPCLRLLTGKYGCTKDCRLENTDVP